ncbi:MAG: hypothetical protein JSV30_03940 [Candidatus Omnitrophota bacterium]|nr:MAG: hypothetical protein JSV30_03940 [Candidatus Omnitrophota bacterium]
MKKILSILSIAIILSAFLYSALAFGKSEEQLNYTLISSRDLAGVNSTLRQSIKTLFPDSRETYLEYNSTQARKYIKELDIKFVPFVIYDKSIANRDAFFHMVRHKMVVKVKDYYVIPDEQLKLGTVMLLDRKRKPNRLDMFVGAFCPYSKTTQAELIDFIRQRDIDIDLNLRYLVKVHEFGISSFYGPSETKEDIAQIIIQKHYPDKFRDYLLLIQDKNREEALKELGISADIIESKKEWALEILKDDSKEAESLQIKRSPTFLWENVYLIPNLEGLKQYEPFKRKALASAARKVASGVIAIDFFYSNACSSCREIKNRLLSEIESEYKDKIEINYHNISDSDALALKLKMEKEYGLSKGPIPEVFLPNIALRGKEQIKKELKGAIKALSEQEAVAAERIEAGGDNAIIDNFSTFSPALVITAGLIDGINPCAFATLIFFVSLLALNSYGRRQIACVGATFIISVFLTYLAIGLGIFQGLQRLEVFSRLSRLIYYAIALLVLGLGVYNLCDYIRYKKTGQMKGCGLKLHDRLRDIADSRRPLAALIAATFVTGCIVALFEFPCTGQVYFPTIAFVLKVPHLRASAFLYLILYNLVFTLPLVAVFLLADKGFASEKFALFTNRHLDGIKIATVVLFFSLAILLFIL